MISDQNTRNTKLLLASSLMISVMVAGCSSDSDSVLERQPSAPQTEEYRGIWERTGYGDVFVVDESGADLYQYTRMGCVEAERLNNNDVADNFNEPSLSTDGTSLITKSKDNLAFDTHFERLEMLPAACETDALITDATPTAAFEHLWHTFNDYYAFFSERGVDWDAQYAEIAPLVDDSLSSDELLEVFEALLEPLDDGHVVLSDGDEVYGFAAYRGANSTVAETFDEQTEFDDIQDYANFLSQRYIAIRSAYLDEGRLDSAGYSSGKGVWWGTINQQVGYLRVGRMEGLTTNEDDSIDANLSAINTIMESALTDLQDTSDMIIDVRANDGGDDVIGLAIANHFTDETRLAVSKSAHSFAGDTDVVEAYISPADDTPYLNPIVVIAAPDTSSAAEVFVLAMNTLPHVTLVGENSNGIFSDILGKTLSNGWEFALSNEVYTDYQGTSYEVSGIPPDVEAPTFSVEAIQQNTDAAIDAALQTLGF